MPASLSGRGCLQAGAAAWPSDSHFPGRWQCMVGVVSWPAAQHVRGRRTGGALSGYRRQAADSRAARQCVSCFVPFSALPPAVHRLFALPCRPAAPGRSGRQASRGSPLVQPLPIIRLAGHSTSRRLRRAWVMVSSSTYSNSSPKPMPRAMEVTFSPGNCRSRFIR